jgi:hypothetical protein
VIGLGIWRKIEKFKHRNSNNRTKPFICLKSIFLFFNMSGVPKKAKTKAKKATTTASLSNTRKALPSDIGGLEEKFHPKSSPPKSTITSTPLQQGESSIASALSPSLSLFQMSVESKSNSRQSRFPRHHPLLVSLLHRFHSRHRKVFKFMGRRRLYGKYIP